MLEENTSYSDKNSNPLLNVAIIVGVLLLLGAALFLYIRFDGKNAKVSAGETSKTESNINLSGKQGALAEGQEAPDFTLSDPSGKNFTLSEFKGKPTFVVFEATWCTFCHQQNSDIERIQKDFGERVNVVSIDLREDVGTVLNAWQQRKNTRLVLVDSNGEVGATYGVTGTPTNIFLDSEGKVYFKHPGLMGYDQMKEAINQLI